MKASARSNGRKLWKDEPQEGIDGRNPRDSGVSTNSSREQGPEGGHAVPVPPRGVVVRRATSGGQWAPRGAPIAIEEKPLKGEAHGRSGAQAPGGPVVDVAQGVPKPRTRHAVAEGSATDERVRRLDTVS
jgi:hypothetical protein